MPTNENQLAIVTGASSRFGYELAKLCAENGFNLIVAADEPEIQHAAQKLRKRGAQVTALQVDLATKMGIAQLYTAGVQPIDVLLVNVGENLKEVFHDEDLQQAWHAVDTNVIGTMHFVHQVARDMLARGHGRILITDLIAVLVPGITMPVYNATKAFVDSFVTCLGKELTGSGVKVTFLQLSGTDQKVLPHSKMPDTNVAQVNGNDPAKAARMAFDAMMDQETRESDLKNERQTTSEDNETPNLWAELMAMKANPELMPKF